MSITSLLSRQGRTTLALGQDLMNRQVGERLPTVQEHAERLSASVGTIQNALVFLQEEGYVKLQPRGHQGTFLVEISRKKLWRLIHPNDLSGAMPLPYSPRYEGLATALCEGLNDADLPLNLVFMRGAVTRLNSLKARRCDFIILSTYSATGLQAAGHQLEILLRLGPGTYVGEHVLVFSDPGHTHIEEGMRVGIDSKSIDQSYLTRQAVDEKNVELVEISYMQLPAALQARLIDATTWNKDELLERYPSLHTAPLLHGTQSAANTEACIVTMAEGSDVSLLLKEVLVTENINRIQRQVMNGERLPSY